MSDLASNLEKPEEPGGPIDMPPVSPPRENSPDGGELDDHGVEEEPIANNAVDEEAVEQGEQPAPLQLRRSNR
ncbi:hypothetical protein PIB30_086401, partial [Stylosanthes scabra]|nr:hypothetical protein [Stylosanthes scabra]